MLINLASQYAPWLPARLFANGQQGVWYEPKPQYLFQDSAGTVPVTADGDPVGYMQDLSGNGNHATQSTAAAKPLYSAPGTADFDGTDDFIRYAESPAIAQPTTHIIAFQLTQTGSTQNIFNGAGTTDERQFLIEAFGQFQIFAGGSIVSIGAVDTDPHVITAVFDGASSYARIDGVQVFSGTTGTNPWSGTTLGASPTGGDPGAVDLHGYAVTTEALTTEQIERTEQYLASLQGRTL